VQESCLQIARLAYGRRATPLPVRPNLVLLPKQRTGEGSTSSPAKIEKEFGGQGVPNGHIQHSFVVGIDRVFRGPSCVLGLLDVVHLHDVDDDGTLSAFNQERLFVGTAFVNESYQSFLTSRTIDFGKPLPEFVGSSRIHAAYSNSEHEKSIA
jgi:hypothetical protein